MMIVEDSELTAHLRETFPGDIGWRWVAHKDAIEVSYRGRTIEIEMHTTYATNADMLKHIDERVAEAAKR